MLEYIFFDEGLRQRFVAFAASHQVAAALSEDGGCLVLVPEDLSDDVAEALDACYEDLLQENAQLLEDTEDALEKSVAGVRVQLPNGTACNIRFDPNLLARLLNCISAEELRDLVQHIAVSLENPDGRPICQT